MFHRVWQQQQQEDEEEVRERKIVYRDTIFENPYQSQLPQFSVLPADVALPLPSPSPATNREKPLRENKKRK